jgi:hypothetical protein
MRARPLLLVLLAALAIAVSCQEQDEAPAPEPARGRRLPRPPRILTEAPPIEPFPADEAPSELIGPFRSMMTFDEVLATIDEDLPYEVSISRRIEERGTCPGQHIVDLMVKRFWDLDRKGTLVLTFYDDILARAWFQTGDVEGYRVAFFDAHQIERPNRWKPSYILPGTEITTPITGNQGVVAEDFRLARWASTIEKACRYQWQVERGWTGPDADPDAIPFANGEEDPYGDPEADPYDGYDFSDDDD